MKFKEWVKEMEDVMEANAYRGIMYIMRGVPGSGKSYTAKQLVDGDTSKIFSTDAFFSDKYEFDFKLLDKAHNWNQENVREAMQKGITPIVVDNTNILKRDAMIYVIMAKKYQYKPIIKESNSPWWQEIVNLIKNNKKSVNNEAIQQWADKLAHGFEYEGNIIKNTHTVPPWTIHKMLRQYTPYDINN